MTDSRPRVATAVRMAVGAVACVTAVITVATFARAAPNGDPPGANGTVKIDGLAFDDGIDNEPHVSCEFRVDFFNFDEGERANIVFTVHPPTGSDTELLRLDNALVSEDPAGGGAPDPDESFVFTADQLGLGAFTPHPQQGFHVKLTVERIGAPGAGKHKVFWVGPCASPSPTRTRTPTSPPPKSPSHSPSPSMSPSMSPSHSPPPPPPTSTSPAPSQPPSWPPTPSRSPGK